MGSIRAYSRLVHGRPTKVCIPRPITFPDDPPVPQRKPIELTFSLEFLTPAVLGGSQPRRVDPFTPLRPGSLRGLWRYWFRALAASLMWPERGPGGEGAMLKELREAEARLFGDTSRRSPVVLLPPELLPPPGKKIPFNLRIPDQREQPGLRYLGYGLFEDRDKKPPECIPEGSKATITCLLRPYASDGPTIGALCATLWIWTAIGGIGGRSRRGYGSVRLTAINTPKTDEYAEILRPWQQLIALRGAPEEYLAALGGGIGRAQDAMTAFLQDQRLGDKQLRSDAQGPHIAIRTLDGLAAANGLRHSYNSGLEALDHAGSLFQDFRSTLRRSSRKEPPLADYFEVKGSLKAPFTTPRHVMRAAFGLPLPFYFRSLGGASTRFSPRPAHSKKADRLASPLFFRVYRLNNNKYGVALLNLAGKPTAKPLLGCTIEQHRKRGRIPAPSARILDDFINWAKAQPYRPKPPQSNKRRRRRR